MSRPRREDPFSTRKLVTATHTMDAICARIAALLPVAAADASDIGPVRNDLERLVAQGIRSIPSIDGADERHGNFSALRNYQLSAARFRELVRRAAALAPPEAKTLADALDQIQSTEALKVEYKSLKTLLEKDPAFRQPVDQALQGGAPSLALVLSVLYLWLRRPRRD